MNDRMPQVGAPDPELDTSPIVDEDEELQVGPAFEQGDACYFNGVALRWGSTCKAAASCCIANRAACR